MYFFCVFVAREFFYESPVKGMTLRTIPTGRSFTEFWSDYLEVEHSDRPIVLHAEQIVNKSNKRSESQKHTYWHNIFGGNFTEERMFVKWGS